MPMGSKVQVRRHNRRVGGKIYIVKGYKRHKRPMSSRVKKYVPVGTLEIGHDKYGNIINNRVIVRKKASKGIRRMRLSADAQLQENLTQWAHKHKRSIKRGTVKRDAEFDRDVKQWLKNKLEEES